MSASFSDFNGFLSKNRMRIINFQEMVVAEAPENLTRKEVAGRIEVGGKNQASFFEYAYSWQFLLYLFK